MAQIRVKRVYEEAGEEDGLRVLVDRLWPRGVSKERARLDHWLKEIAPSNGLRVDFHSGVLDFEAFGERYRSELEGNPAVEELRGLVEGAEVVTLLYGSRDEERNHARVLREFLGEG